MSDAPGETDPSEKSRSLRRAVATALKRGRKKREKLAAELDAAAHAKELEEQGELIKANLGAVQRGMTEIALPDFYHPGQTRTIRLAPFLKPMDNARRYFKQAQKAERGRELIREQLEHCDSECAALDTWLRKYDAWAAEAEPGADVPDELAAEAAKLRVHVEGVTPDSREPASKKHELPRGVRMFVSHDGLKIYVGKNAEDNDYLSFRIAHGNDWWFHAAHVPGSHVVVKGAEGALPQETLLDALHLAVYFSKHRNAARAEVTKAQAKQLRKIKGAPTGQVQVQNGATVTVRMEEERLHRLLKGET